MSSFTWSIATLLINTIASSKNPVDASLDAALANLAEISLGQTPSIWPLAWGWWVLTVLVVLIVVGFFWLIARHINKYKFKRSALKAVENISGTESQALSTLHAILRSALIHYFPSENISSLQGIRWQQRLKFSAQHCKKVDGQCLTQLTQLEASLYTKKPSIAAAEAKNAVYLWIKYCLPPTTAQLQSTETIVPSSKGDRYV